MDDHIFELGKKMEVGEPSTNTRIRVEVKKEISNILPYSPKSGDKLGMNRTYHTRHKCKSDIAISTGFKKELKNFEYDNMIQIPLSQIEGERRKESSSDEPLVHKSQEEVEATDTLLSINTKWGLKGERNSLKSNQSKDIVLE